MVSGLFLCVLVPVYWHHYGPANFLWLSDVALFAVFAALWLRNALLNSMMAIGVLPFELFWIADFLSSSRLLDVTAYMFDDALPLYLRALSLFHFGLPAMIVFLLFRLGFDRRALLAQTALLWVLLPLSYVVTDAQRNINYTMGWAKEPQTWMPPLIWLGLEMILLPLLVYLPTHLVLRRLFGPR